MPHPFDDDRINVPLVPAAGQLHLDLGHWLKTVWLADENLNCEVPATTCAEDNMFLESDQEYMKLDCENPFSQPYVRIEDFGFVPSYRPRLNRQSQRSCIPCTAGTTTLIYRVYHSCKAKSMAMGQLFLCRIIEAMPRTLPTQIGVYTTLQNNGFTAPQKTRRGMWMYSQSLLLTTCIASVVSVSECEG